MRPLAVRDDDGRIAVRRIAVVLVAAGVTTGLALTAAAAFGLPGTVAVTAVANVFLAFRGLEGLPPRRRWLELPLLALLIAAAGAFGLVLLHAPLVGAPLFALAVAASAWARRFGPRGRRIARVAAAPFVSVLVVPVPVLALGHGAPLVVPLLAIAGQVVTVAVLTVADLVAPPHVLPEAPPAIAGRAASGERRLVPTTRHALQQLVALLAAFAVGLPLFGRHWPWVVVTAYVVSAVGILGRGGAVLRAMERLAGALAGAVLGVLVALVPLPDAIRVALVLVLLAVGAGLRARAYVVWALALTASLALIDDVLGIPAEGALAVRVLAVITGGAIAIAAAWFLLPIRSADVLRRRVGTFLTAVQEALRTLREEPDGFAAALQRVDRAELDRVTPEHRAHARLALALRRPQPPAPAVLDGLAALDRALHGLDPDAARAHPRAIGALERRVGRLRRVNARREVTAPRPDPEWPGGLVAVADAVTALADPIERLAG